MSRHLATIQRLTKLVDIANADNIQRATIKDWHVVVEKGKFKEGELVIFCEIDSLLPLSNPAFCFLAGKTTPKTQVVDGKEYIGYRLKTIRLRKQLSQGLALPLAILDIESLIGARSLGDDAIGYDVSELLGIVKYEAPIPAQLMGKIKGQFPNFLKKTDEERIQNLGELLTKMAGTVCYITEKLDGSSATFFKKDGVFGVCSRNLELLETDGNTFWELAKTYDIANRLPDNTAIQGEVIGSGIQGNYLKLQGHDLHVFNVFNIDSQSYLDLQEFEEFCKTHNFKTVPILDRAYVLPVNVEDVLAIANGASVGLSTAKREGIVIRPVNEMLVEIDDKPSRFSFKAISNEFLLNEKE